MSRQHLARDTERRAATAPDGRHRDDGGDGDDGGDRAGGADAPPRPAADLATRRRRVQDAAATILVPALVALMALAFALPWRTGPDPGGPTLARYAPMRDAGSALFAEYGDCPVSTCRQRDGNRMPTSWQSHNLAVVPWLRGLTSTLRRAAAPAILAFYVAPNEPPPSPAEWATRLAEVQILERQIRTLNADGRLETTLATLIREARGQFLVGIYDATGDRDLVYDPPLLLLPPDLGPGREWEGTGLVAGSITYTLRGRVSEAGPSDAPDPGDCLLVETRLTYDRDGDVIDRSTSTERYCAGDGLVETRSEDAAGGTMRWVRVAALDGPTAPDGFPPPSPGLPPPVLGDPADPADWSASRLGRSSALPGAVSTIPPIWVPSDPPLLLAAGYGGDLVAFDARGPANAVRWSFHPGGTVYGPPTFDPARGRVYFGASDRRLYALDVRGLFLWSFETGDNVASRPLVAGDTVIFGSEDRSVYGVDAETGARRWAAPTGGAVVSWPALVRPDPAAGSEQGGTVVIGSDDGSVYGLDPTTGARIWTYAADGAVEAPVVAADGIAYAGSRGGSLAALDGATGEPLWATRLSGGPVVRTTAAVGRERVYVVDDRGFLAVLDRADGRQLGPRLGGRFVGPPVTVGDAVLVAESSGTIARLDADGAPHGHWSMEDAGGPSEAFPSVVLGPTRGGDAVWLADHGAVVHRLGPGTVRPEPSPVRR